MTSGLNDMAAVSILIDLDIDACVSVTSNACGKAVLQYKLNLSRMK
jgi:hypothetical protein